jgi:hypothetical protein
MKGSQMSAAPFPEKLILVLRKQLNAANVESIGLRIETASYPDLLAFKEFRLFLVVDLI